MSGTTKKKHVGDGAARVGERGRGVRVGFGSGIMLHLPTRH